MLLKLNSITMGFSRTLKSSSLKKTFLLRTLLMAVRILVFPILFYPIRTLKSEKLMLMWSMFLKFSICALYNNIFASTRLIYNIKFVLMLYLNFKREHLKSNTSIYCLFRVYYWLFVI